MKKFSILPILILTILFIFGSGTKAQAKTLEFINYTGTTIDYLYISNANASGWGGNLLGNSSISHNGTYNLNIPSNAPRYIKMKIILRGGRDIYWDNIDLSSLWRITFIKNGNVIRANWN